MARIWESNGVGPLRTDHLESQPTFGVDELGTGHK
jgi:hypothetical protein